MAKRSVSRFAEFLPHPRPCWCRECINVAVKCRHREHKGQPLVGRIAKSRPCEGCGYSFTPADNQDKKARFCSAKCIAASKGQTSFADSSRIYWRTCCVCSKVHGPFKEHFGRWSCDTCKPDVWKRYEAKRRDRGSFSKTLSTCKVCGVEFRLKRGSDHHGRVVCYGECSKPPKPPKPPKPLRHCKGCSAVLSSDHGNRKWCSEICRKIQYRSPHTEIEFRHCERCGKLFCCRAGSNALCCSTRCTNNRSKSIRRHRLRTAGKQCDQITLFALGERDGWRCHLCGKKVPNREHKNRMLDPEIDHLIPVSAGGEHVWENVALSHRRCNYERREVGAAQLRLLA